jgi:hypothetical protein
MAPARVGAGRVNVTAALANNVVAYNAETSGAVSVSFGAVEVLGTLTQDKTIRVVNKGTSEVTYTLGYDERTAIPGVSYSFPDDPTVTVPANGETTFKVRLSADAAQMKNSRDTTVSNTQGTPAAPRQWLSEASGLITLTPTSGTALRVPVYATARPASAMTTEATSVLVTEATFTATLTLSGTGVATGPRGPNEHNALLTAFELQGSSPKLDSPPAGAPPTALKADLQYIGANANSDNVYFGVTTWRDFTTPSSDLQFSIFIDRDRDGTDDLELYNTRTTGTDVLITTLQDLITEPAPAPRPQGQLNIFNSDVPTAIFNNNIVVLPLKIADLGMPNGSTRFNYRIESYSSDYDEVFDSFPASGYLTYDFANRGLNFSGGIENTPAFADVAGASVLMAFNQANYLANGSTGALLLHHYNKQGNRAQVLPLVPQVAYANPPTAKSYGDAPFKVAATATGGQTVSYSSTTPTVCTVAGDEVTLVGAGDCTVRASTAAGSFSAAQAQVTIPVAKATLTVTVNNASRTVGQPNPAFSVRYEGFVNNDSAAALGGTLTFSTTATTTSPLGTYQVTASGLTSNNYTIVYRPGTLTITNIALYLPLVSR